MSGSCCSAASNADRGSSASPTMSKSGSCSRIWRMPRRNRAWSSTSRILHPLIGIATVRAAAPPLRACVAHHHDVRLLSRGSSFRRTVVPAAAPDTISSQPPTSWARSRMNRRPKWRRPACSATSSTENPRPSSWTSRTHQSWPDGSACGLEARGHLDPRGPRVLAHVAERLEGDPQHGRARGHVEHILGCGQVDLDPDAGLLAPAGWRRP